jgi:hypothetical protein
MRVNEAVLRFRAWSDRSVLPIASEGGSPCRDTWPEVAAAAVQIVGRLDSATTDDDLRAALAEWVALRAGDPLAHSAMDGQLTRAAHEALYDVLYPRDRDGHRCLVVQPGPSARHQIHVHRRTVDVSPDLARAILDLNAETRGVTLECPDGCIVAFMAKIRAGEWTAQDPNPNTTPRIAAQRREDFDGKLLGGIEFVTAPGEHRLQSIVNAGRTVPVEFVAPLAAFECIAQLAAAEAAATSV